MTHISDPTGMVERGVRQPNGERVDRAGIRRKSDRRRPPTLAHRIEYGALRGVVGLLKRIGLRSASAVGAGLGNLGYRPLAIRREVVERQVRAAFPELSPNEVQRIAQGELRASRTHDDRDRDPSALRSRAHHLDSSRRSRAGASSRSGSLARRDSFSSPVTSATGSSAERTSPRAASRCTPSRATWRIRSSIDT